MLKKQTSAALAVRPELVSGSLSEALSGRHRCHLTYQVGCSQRIRRKKATADRMYAALDLHERSIQVVLKDDCGGVVRESKMGKDEERILEFLDGTGAKVVMESGYNHQHIFDVLKANDQDTVMVY